MKKKYNNNKYVCTMYILYTEHNHNHDMIYLKSMSSTLIEFISTTNILNLTITGVPFFDGGLTSEKKRIHYFFKPL